MAQEINSELFRFYAPEWLILLALPPLLLLFYRWTERSKALAVARLVSRAHFESLVRAPRRGREWTRVLLFALGLAFLSLALARPQFGQNLEPVERKGMDIHILLDASLSMKVEDAPPSRFERAKEEIRKLLLLLEGDRVGLTLFSNAPLKIIPFTTDYSAIEKYLDLVNPEIFVQTGTHIESALASALPSFDKSPNGGVILVFSDGEDEPGLGYTLAREAKSSGPIRVYCFGVGTGAGGPIPMRTKEGAVEYKQDANGQRARSALAEVPLKTIAALHGGKYYPASPEGAREFVTELNSMKKALIETRKVYRYQDYFEACLLAGFLLILVGRLLEK